jgi:hypothetical protein
MTTFFMPQNLNNYHQTSPLKHKFQLLCPKTLNTFTKPWPSNNDPTCMPRTLWKNGVICNLAIRFLSCNDHLQLICNSAYFSECECYQTSCMSCNSPYIYSTTHCNFVTTTFFQLLCNSPMTTTIMSRCCQFSSIHQNLAHSTLEIFWCFS